MTAIPTSTALIEVKRARNSLDEWIAKAADNDQTHLNVHIDWARRIFSALREAAAALAEQDATLVKVREVLTRYGRHDPSCPSYDDGRPEWCLCGYTEKLDALATDAQEATADRPAAQRFTQSVYEALTGEPAPASASPRSAAQEAPRYEACSQAHPNERFCVSCGALEGEGHYDPCPVEAAASESGPSVKVTYRPACAECTLEPKVSALSAQWRAKKDQITTRHPLDLDEAMAYARCADDLDRLLGEQTQTKAEGHAR